jgi:proline-specific peptidase
VKAVKEGHIKHRGFEIYYQVFGQPSSDKKPLLVLHGGPGSGHNYLLGLAKLADEGRQVIYYDQLGCGESDMPDDTSLWTIEQFVSEVAAVRSVLGLSAIHLLGHSLGGMLAIEYLLTRPTGIQSAVLASSMISMPLFQQEVDKLKRALPGNTFEVMTKHEKAGTTESEEYQAAYREYSRRHLFRGDIFPAELHMADEKDGKAVYHYMWGASEAYGDGTLKDWDRINRLPEIKLPALITSGQYDELTPWQAGITRDQLPDASLRIFTNGTHLTHVEQPEEYLATVAAFLDKHD